MSVRVMADVWLLDIPPNEKIVLLAYADNARDDGRAWPSRNRISFKTGYHPDTVKKIVQRLRQRGVLVVEKQGRGHGSGKGLAPVVRVRIPPELVRGGETSPLSTLRGGETSGEGGRMVPLRGGETPPPTITEPSQNHNSDFDEIDWGEWLNENQIEEPF